VFPARGGGSGPRLVVAGQARSKQHEQRGGGSGAQRAASARPLRPGPGGGSSLTQPRGRRQQRRGKTCSAWPRQVATHCKADNFFSKYVWLGGLICEWLICIRFWDCNFGYIFGFGEASSLTQELASCFFLVKIDIGPSCISIRIKRNHCYFKNLAVYICTVALETNLTQKQYCANTQSAISITTL